MIVTERLELVPTTPALLRAESDGQAAFGSALGARVPSCPRCQDNPGKVRIEQGAGRLTPPTVTVLIATRPGRGVT